MPRIVVRNVQDLTILQTKLNLLAKSLPNLQKVALEKTAAAKILQEIKQRMRANNFSQKIIDGTEVGPIDIIGGNKAQIHFISDFESESGFDVANAREEGTEPGPKRKVKDPTSAFPIPIPGGETIFRKSFQPKRGIERLLIIERTIKQRAQQAVTDYQNAFAKLVGPFLGGR